MPAPTSEIEGASVVLIGNFNPAIIHPAWLVRHDLVRQSEEAAATVQLVRPELSLFSVGPFTLHTEPSRFTCSIVDLGQLEPLRDLVKSIFTLLSQTPIRAIGLNRQMHFRVSSDEVWHRVGNELAPPTPWEGLVDDAGLKTLTIGQRDPTKNPRQQVTVEPSVRMPHGVKGVYVAVNQHFESKTEDASDVLTELSASWSSFFAQARRIGESVAAMGMRS
jgi:hypothetical protein